MAPKFKSIGVAGKCQKEREGERELRERARRPHPLPFASTISKFFILTLLLLFSSLHTGIAAGDVKDLQASVQAFGDAVLDKVPASQSATANALIAKYNADLANAAAAYA